MSQSFINLTSAYSDKFYITTEISTPVKTCAQKCIVFLWQPATSNHEMSSPVVAPASLDIVFKLRHSSYFLFLHIMKLQYRDVVLVTYGSILCGERFIANLLFKKKKGDFFLPMMHCTKLQVVLFTLHFHVSLSLFCLKLVQGCLTSQGKLNGMPGRSRKVHFHSCRC